MTAIRIFLVVVCLSVPRAATCQDSLPSYTDVLDLTYVPGTTPPATPEESYLNTFHWFLTAVLTSDDAAFEQFFDAFELTRTLAAQAPESALNRYFLTEITIQSGFLKLKFGQELSAAWTMRAAYRQARENYSSDPDNPLFLKSWGVMQVLVGAIPDNYQWIPELFGVKGSILTGIALLNDIPPTHWLHLESRVIVQLTRSYLLDESRRAAGELSGVVRRAESPLLDYLYLTVCLRAHQAQEVLDFYATRERSLALSAYATANAALQAGLYAKAEGYLRNFLKNYPGQDFRKDATYKAFLACYLSGENERATEYFNRIHATGTSDTESDRYALKAAGLPWPDRHLMKIRLATDGGFYDNARALLQNVSIDAFELPEEKTEFIYREARLEQLTGNLEQAVGLYRQVLVQQGEAHMYFAPNSCLQLGYILLAMDQPEEARKYFSRVFDYRSYEYQKGIERKAHSALVTHFDGS